MHDGEAETAAHDQFGVIVAELFLVPLLDQFVEHIEVMREVDDAGGIAMRKAYGDVAGEGAGSRHKSFLEHVTTS